MMIRICGPDWGQFTDWGQQEREREKRKWSLSLFIVLCWSGKEQHLVRKKKENPSSSTFLILNRLGWGKRRVREKELSIFLLHLFIVLTHTLVHKSCHKYQASGIFLCAHLTSRSAAGLKSAPNSLWGERELKLSSQACIDDSSLFSSPIPCLPIWL